MDKKDTILLLKVRTKTRNVRKQEGKNKGSSYKPIRQTNGTTERTKIIKTEQNATTTTNNNNKDGQRKLIDKDKTEF